MTEKQAVKAIMGFKRVTQAELAKLAGLKAQTNVTGLLNNAKPGYMRVENLIKLLNALDCDLIVKDRNGQLTLVIDGKDG